MTAHGWEKALLDAGSRAQSALDGALESFAPTGRGIVQRAASALEGLARAAPTTTRAAPPVEREDEPPVEDPEKAALLKRFAELEKKLKER